MNDHRIKAVLEDFAAVITRDDSLPKPHPEGVYKAAARMGVECSELMVVGDFRFDILAGKAANAVTVLLHNAGESVLADGDPKPDHEVGHLLQVLEILSLPFRNLDRLTGKDGAPG